MEYPLADQPVFADPASFVKALNKARLAVGKRWMGYVGTVAGKAVRIKTYGTGYLQILEVNGRKSAPPMDMSVTEWKDSITEALA